MSPFRGDEEVAQKLLGLAQYLMPEDYLSDRSLRSHISLYRNTCRVPRQPQPEEEAQLQRHAGTAILSARELDVFDEQRLVRVIDAVEDAPAADASLDLS